MITVYHGGRIILRHPDPLLFVRNEELGITLQFGAESVSFRQVDADGDICGEARGDWRSILSLVRGGLPWAEGGEDADRPPGRPSSG